MEMKKVLWSLLLSTLVFTGCNNNDDNSEWGNNDLAVTFSSSIEGLVKSKAAGNSWGINDAAGIFMKKAGQELSDASIVGGATNRKYQTFNGDGNFSPAAGETIYYPEDGSNVDFVAYYPHSTSVNDYNYAVDVSTQTVQEAIDLMYANNATNLNKSTGKANLNFSHCLSKIILNVKAGDGIGSLDGLGVTLKGMKTTASFALADGTLTIHDDSETDIVAKNTTITDGVTVEAIILPVDGLNGGSIVFSLPNGSYNWTIPAGQRYEKGRKYTYSVELKNSGGDQGVVVGASITDWTDVPSGNINVDFGDGGTTPDPEPATQTIFEETFENGDASAKPLISAYTGWDNGTPIVFSDSYGKSSVRNLSSTTGTNNPGNNVWIPKTGDASLKIEGINTTGYTNIKLSYKQLANVYSAGESTDLNTLQVKWNGVSLTVPSKVVSAPDAKNMFFTMEIETVLTDGGDSNTLEFYAPQADNAYGFRVDDIKIVGDK